MLYDSQNGENNPVYLRLRRPVDSGSHHMEDKRSNENILASSAGFPYDNATILTSSARNIASDGSRLLPSYLDRQNLLNRGKFSYPESMIQRDVSQLNNSQQQIFGMKRDTFDRQARKSLYFQGGGGADDNTDDTLLVTYLSRKGGSPFSPQSFHEIAANCPEIKVDDQMNTFNKRRSHIEPLENPLVLSGNKKSLVDNSLALVQFPSQDGQVSIRQPTSLPADRLLHSQNNFPQQSNFSYFPRKQFFNQFASPYFDRGNQFARFMPNRPPFSAGYPSYMNNPFSQNRPSFRMGPRCEYMPYMQSNQCPCQECCSLSGRQKPSGNFDWDCMNDPDYDQYPWNQNDPTYMDLPNYPGKNSQNNFGFGPPNCCRDTSYFQDLPSNMYNIPPSTLTNIDEIDPTSDAYLEKIIPNFNILPPKSNLKIGPMAPELAENYVKNYLFVPSNQTRIISPENSPSEVTHQTSRSTMLSRLATLLERSIDMSSYSMNFDGNYIDNRGLLVDPFQTYITDLEQGHSKPQGGGGRGRRSGRERTPPETMSTQPSVVILRNSRSDVMTLDEGDILKNTAKRVEENEDETKDKMNDVSFLTNLTRRMDLHDKPQEHEDMAGPSQQNIFQSHPALIAEAMRRENNVRDDYCVVPPYYPAPGARERYFQPPAAAEGPIDMMPLWEQERIAREREFHRYKSQFNPGNRMFLNATTPLIKSEIYDDRMDARNVTTASQQGVGRDREGADETSYRTMADYLQSPAAKVNPRLLNKLGYQNKTQSSKDVPFVTEASDDSDTEREKAQQEEVIGADTFARLKNRFETERRNKLNGEDNTGVRRKHRYFRGLEGGKLLQGPGAGNCPY